MSPKVLRFGPGGSRPDLWVSNVSTNGRTRRGPVRALPSTDTLWRSLAPLYSVGRRSSRANKELTRDKRFCRLTCCLEVTPEHTGHNLRPNFRFCGVSLLPSAPSPLPGCLFHVLDFSILQLCTVVLQSELLRSGPAPVTTG